MAITVTHDIAPSGYGNLAYQAGRLARRDEIAQRVQQMHMQRLAMRQAARQAEQGRRLQMVQMQAKQAEAEAARAFQREMLDLRSQYEQRGYRDKAGVDQQNAMQRMEFAANEKRDAQLASLAAEEALLAKKMDAERDQFQWEFSERQKQEMTQYNQNLQRIDEALEAGELSPVEHAEARNQVLRKLVGIKKQPSLKEDAPWPEGQGPGQVWPTTLSDGTEVMLTRDSSGNVKELSRREPPDFTKVLDAAIKSSTGEDGVADPEKVKEYMRNARAMWESWSGKTSAADEAMGDMPRDWPAPPGMGTGAAAAAPAEQQPRLSPTDAMEVLGDAPGYADVTREEAEKYLRTKMPGIAASAAKRFNPEEYERQISAAASELQQLRSAEHKERVQDIVGKAYELGDYDSRSDAELAVYLNSWRMPGPTGLDGKRIKDIRAAVRNGDTDALRATMRSMKFDNPEDAVRVLSRIKKAKEEGLL